MPAFQQEAFEGEFGMPLWLPNAPVAAVITFAYRVPSLPRQAWEDDFEIYDFFTKPYVKPKKPTAPKKQGRVQLSAGADLSRPVVLWVTCPSG
jgi:hypothetical protein